MERSLILNRWKTPDGTVLISRHTHDFVSHKDANGEDYFIDGGNEYVRMSVNKEEMENMCVYSDDQFSVIRKVLCRGTFDENDKRIWIPLCNMSNPHLENCVTYYARSFNEDGCTNRYMIYYLVELLFRWCLNEYIDEKTYTKKDAEYVSKAFVENTRSIEDTLDYGIVESVIKFAYNIDSGIHSDKEETIMLVKHIIDLWSEKDTTIKEMLKNWNIK